MSNRISLAMKADATDIDLIDDSDIDAFFDGCDFEETARLFAESLTLPPPSLVVVNDKAH